MDLINFNKISITDSNSKEFFWGIKLSIPLMLSYVPFGLACGVMASHAGLSVFETTMMSLMVFAGSAQFLTIGMIGQGAGVLMIIVSTLLINLRHLLLGLSLAPYLSKQKSSWLYLLAFGLTDEAYACTISYYQKSENGQGSPYFMLGSSLGLYTFWVCNTTIGNLLGNMIQDPLSWGLDFAMTATFLSILIPQIKNFRILVVAAVAGIVAVAFCLYIPGNWYVILSTVLAVILGTIMEIRSERRCGK